MANVTILEIGALIDDGMMAGNGHTPVNFIPNSDPLHRFVPTPLSQVPFCQKILSLAVVHIPFIFIHFLRSFQQRIFP